MSAQRPNFIDLRSQSQASIPRPLKSPRIHVAGEAPPEFSPLDAFAHQSRMLARQLKESTKQGRRMSRLPPLTTDSPLIVQGRSDYFRSMSQDSGSENDESPSAHQPFGLALSPAVEDDISNRPRSMHPRMSRIPPTPDEMMPMPTKQFTDTARGRPLNDIDESDSFFGVHARREQSPTPMENASVSEKQSDSRSNTYDTLSVPSPTTMVPLSNSPEKFPVKKSSFDSAGLFPPRQLFPKRSSSIMSSPLESTDGEGMNSMGSSFSSQSSSGLRNHSFSSGLASPSIGAYQRSPSISSDNSGLPRPSFNFSRPLSRAGTPSLDLPIRQTSSDSQASFVLADEAACTPISMTGEGFPDGLAEDGTAAAPSFIYSKFSLPRGKILQRTSALFLEGPPAPHAQWEQPPSAPPSHAQPFPMGGQAPPSPPTRPASSASSRIFEDPIPRPSLERSKLSTEVLRPTQQPSPDPSRPSTEGSRQSEDTPRGRPLTSPLHDAMRSKTPLSITTSDSASTIKARSQHSTAPTMHDISPDEHVSKAIALHEKGSLNESTYHLRHAARQGHPTGMLLYALACRHGWGMRSNQREGVEWLRKAVESASVEIADDEENEKEGKSVDKVEQKTRKAQLALSVYELGVSHMNGWGIVQDKALALRCFEIAGCEFKQTSLTTCCTNELCSLG